ncbi:MAG: outer membrane beta-barrel protein [Ignavibacteriaceae bacterium]
MKYYILLFSALLLTGCTYNRVLSQYETKDEYFKALNSISENKKVKIETKDSSFTLEDIVVNENVVTGKFFRYDDSRFSYFIYSPPEETKVIIPAGHIRSISVTKRTFSIFKGMGIGALAGAIWGGLFIDGGSSSNSGYHPNYYQSAILMTFPGMLFGALVGLIVGDDFIFSFDNQLSRDELFRDNSVHKMGLKVGYHSGFEMFTIPVEGRVGADLNGTGIPGFSITVFYNYILGKNFSFNSELSFISSGSDEKHHVSVYSPENTYTSQQGNVKEKIKVLEAAPLLRLNLAKEGFTPYLVIGPKFCLQFPPGNSNKEKFYSDINKQFGGSNFSVSGEYKKFFWSGVIGAGISTGKLGPYEVFLEIRYSKDITGRFKIDYYNSDSFSSYYYNHPRQEWEHAAEEITFNLGVGIF